jgi:hypothetical protein
VQSSSIILDSDLSRDVQNKPRPGASDSGQACSLQHMLELYPLVKTNDHALDGYVFDDTCLHVA